jgi:hypothetical protein
MKKIFLSVFCISTALFNLQAQTEISDFVILGAQYANQSFYSLENGEAANVSNTNWDLQIATSQRSASIRTNDAKNVQLYALANPDTANWNAIDTTGMYALYNADTSWEIGSFNNIGSMQHPDYGCMAYIGVGQLKGHRLFVIKLNNGSLKKIWIKSLDYYVYTILIGNLDNSDEQTIIIDKELYNTKHFFYYDLENQQVVDTQPEAQEWDFVFKRYYALDSITYLPFNAVTGVLSNKNVQVAESRGVPVNTLTSDNGFTYSSYINTIGYDWKVYDYDNAVFNIISDLCYFVKTPFEDVYKLEFTGFAGGSTGRVYFKKTKLFPITASVNNINTALSNLSVYPNPAENGTNILVSLKTEKSIVLSVYDLTGKQVFSSNVNATAGLNNFYLETVNFGKGFYFVKVSDGNSQLSQKLLVTN